MAAALGVLLEEAVAAVMTSSEVAGGIGTVVEEGSVVASAAGESSAAATTAVAEESSAIENAMANAADATESGGTAVNEIKPGARIFDKTPAIGKPSGNTAHDTLHQLVSDDRPAMRELGISEQYMNDARALMEERRAFMGLREELNLAKNCLPPELRSTAVATEEVTEASFGEVANTNNAVGRGARVVEGLIAAGKKTGSVVIKLGKRDWFKFTLATVGGLSVYKVLKAFAVAHSGCWLVSTSDKRHIERLDSAILNSPEPMKLFDGEIQVKLTEQGMKRRVVGSPPCYGACVKENFTITRSKTRTTTTTPSPPPEREFDVQCIDMNIFEAAALIANNLASIPMEIIDAVRNFGKIVYRYAIPIALGVAVAYPLYKFVFRKRRVKRQVIYNKR